MGTEKWTINLLGQIVHISKCGYTVLRASNIFNHGLIALITHSQIVLSKFKWLSPVKSHNRIYHNFVDAAALSITKFGMSNEVGLKVRM